MQTNPLFANSIQQALAIKKELIRLFIIAALLGFGVGALASLFSTFESVWVVVSIAAAIILVSLCFLARDVLGALTFEDELTAALFVRPEGNEIVPVDDFRFSEELHRVMMAVKAENRSLYADWSNQPIVHSAKQETDAEDPPADRTKSSVPPSDGIVYFSIVRSHRDDSDLNVRAMNFLEETAQFVLLEELSLHLSAYFNSGDDDSLVRELTREDMPHFLLRNRILNLLCTPIEQRNIFMKAFPNNRDRPDGTIYRLLGSDGSLFSRFDLILPLGSKLSATTDGGITIETKRLSLTLRASFSGLNSSTPSARFVRQYLRTSYDQMSIYDVNILISGRIKAFSLFSSSGWKYYAWLDSFRQRMAESCDFEKFLSTIQWRTVETLLHTLPFPDGAPKNSESNEGR